MKKEYFYNYELNNTYLKLYKDRDKLFNKLINNPNNKIKEIYNSNKELIAFTIIVKDKV